MGDAAPDGEPETVTSSGDEAATRQALPADAHARRAAAVAAPSGPRRAAHPSQPPPNVSQQIAIDSLREEDADTARQLILVGRTLALAALAPLPFIDGSVPLEIALAASLVIAILVGFVVERRVTTPTRFREADLIVLALSVAPSLFIAVLYFGVLSAVQLFPALALYFFSRRDNHIAAIGLVATNAVAQGTFATLIIAGVIEDPGLVAPELPAHVFAIGHLLLQLGFLGAFFLGRGSHRASRDAIAKIQKATSLAAQREALLHEARQDLDRALAVEAAGRFTDHTFGSYRLGLVIGRGGMGEVYEAFHVETGDMAAVKLLAQRELGNPQSIERFLREVRAVRGLTSPHVVRVLAASEGGDDIPYFAMERLRGHDLAHHLRSGRMPPSALDEMLAQVGSAVEEAWSKGIVHRDLKPQNLFLADGPGKPLWKVLDFGVAALDESSGTLTQGKVVGTPAYMAPEQARGEKVDHRADVYALGAIAYRWLTGRPVCSGRDLHNALYQTVHVMPQQPSTLTELHVDVDAVLAIALVKQPHDRWQSVAELRAALALAIKGELDPRTRRRAADQLARHPWGAVRR